MLCCQYNTFYIIFSETLSPSLRVSGEGVSTEQNFSRVGDVIGAIPADPEHVRQRPDVHAGIGVRSLHGKRLTGVRLPVREYANIISARKRHAERTFFSQKHATMKKCKHTHTADKVSPGRRLRSFRNCLENHTKTIVKTKHSCRPPPRPPRKNTPHHTATSSLSEGTFKERKTRFDTDNIYSLL